ncbi:MFS transporter [Oceanobacillus neutriphilus]|uniref:MFS transporter n=1 Tax=Oceanobacillus neutriphilus TaxID=531815 RepID=A0ABQ2NQR3_9BACI|nr:MFS transporter [Oceanobacillus neutriphilus]GGP08235.1 MFS transporter [Oceanobacillus neutriphilus]
MENTTESNKYKKKILASSMLGLGLESMDIMFLSFVLSSIIAEFGISSAAGGSIVSITNFGMLVGGVVFGVLADKYGRIRIFTYTIFLFSAATALMAFADNIYFIYILRFLAGVGGGGEFGIGMALVAEVFSKQKRGRMTSWVTIGGQLGAIVAALLAALIIPLFGWRALFITGIIPVLLIFYVRRNLGETEEWKKAQTEIKKGKKKDSSLSKLFNTPKRAYTTIALTIMSTVQVAGYFGLMNWLPSILQEQLGLSVSGSSLWMISTIIGMCLGMLLFGQILDRFGAKTSYGIFLIASAASVFLYVFAQSAVTILIGGVIVGFFANGMNAGYGALISSFYPTEVRSTANNTIFNTGRAIGGLSPIAIGFFLDNYSITAAMAFLSTLYMISLIIILTLRNNPLKGMKHREKNASIKS